MATMTSFSGKPPFAILHGIVYWRDGVLRRVVARFRFYPCMRTHDRGWHIPSRETRFNQLLV